MKWNSEYGEIRDNSSWLQTIISFQKLNWAYGQRKKSFFSCGFNNMDPRLFNLFGLEFRKDNLCTKSLTFFLAEVVRTGDKSSRLRCRFSGHFSAWRFTDLWREIECRWVMVYLNYCLSPIQNLLHASRHSVSIRVQDNPIRVMATRSCSKKPLNKISKRLCQHFATKYTMMVRQIINMHLRSAQ